MEILKSDSARLGLFLSLVLLTETNNRPIIGRCRLSNGRYRLSANWLIIGQYRLSADNRCTSKANIYSAKIKNQIKGTLRPGARMGLHTKIVNLLVTA